MHDAVPHRQRRAAQVAAQPGADNFLPIGDVRRVAGCDVAFHQGFAGGVAHPQFRMRGADALQLAAQARRQLVLVVDVVQVELDAGTAGVDDEDGVAHGSGIR
ncbi:hypothetical protein G6F65_017248 [Rhizopus arrhizus]|nr:hypothetical protein G6F31_017228 [Rhizopus arrhizus]KAG1253923.1 hypothetical protein G6F65_017248 [Rhizopus arrhizus]